MFARLRDVRRMFASVKVMTETKETAEEFWNSAGCACVVGWGESAPQRARGREGGRDIERETVH